MNQNLRRTSTWIPLGLAVTLAIGILIGTYIPSRRSAGMASTDKINTILDYVKREYVDIVDTDSLLEALLPDLMAGLDPHSVYISAKDLMAVNDELEGSFSGIGISFNMMTDTITVIEIISGGPAENVGLMPGDRIISINDTVVAGKGWSNEKVITHLRGPEGTTVKVGIMRDSSDKLLDFEITRGEIPVTSIDASYMIKPGTGYIKVNKFGRTTYSEFLSAALLLRAAGAGKLIVDLRGNGGGYMEMAILMANEFLPEGAPIVSTRGRNRDSNVSTMADGTGTMQDVEIAVIMDEYSASASEIFAGALQDNDRGLIVGRRSFGKGLVQRQITLPDSSAIRLTTARYYTPSGRSIQKRYEHGGTKAYQEDLIERYDRGELFSADSIKLDKSITFYTGMGRPVYGGGGIMPDIFVANDTTGITSYYLNVVNQGILQKFTFEYFDHNRHRLSGANDYESLLKLLPDDDTLLQEFATFAEKKGVPQRWYYINISRDLIVNQLKALIARNALGIYGYYVVDNLTDPSIQRAIKALNSGEAKFPIEPTKQKTKGK